MAVSTTQLSLAGTLYSPFQAAFAAGAAEPSAGVYFAVEPFGNPPTEGPPIYEETENSFVGQDGVATKRFGFRGRLISITLIFANTSKANVETAKATVFTNVSALAAFSVTVPGGSARSACKLVQPGRATIGDWFTIGTKICLPVSFQIKSLRE